jgi:hypothetical protein
LIGSTCSPVAHADGQSGREQQAAAQVLFEQGRELVEQNRFAEGCSKLSESQRLDPGIGTLLWLADCYENAGQTASGWAIFKEAAAAAALRHDARERVARDRAARLEPLLSRLNIVVPADAEFSSLEVRRDDVVVGKAEWGLPMPVDPGAHTVSARAPGRRGWEKTVRLSGRADAVSVIVPSLAPAVALLSAPDGRAAEPPPQSAQDLRAAFNQRLAGTTIAAAGVAGIVVGSFFGFRAKATYDEAETSGHCLTDNECDAIGAKDRNSAFSQATAATIAFGAGAAVLGGGAILFFTAPRGRAPAPTLALSPAKTGGSVRVGLVF